MARSTPNVLIDRRPEERGASLDLLWVVGFSLLTALLAQLVTAQRQHVRQRLGDGFTDRLHRVLGVAMGAAGRLGRGETPEPLPVEGARELRTVSAAFNRMASDLAAM